MPMHLSRLASRAFHWGGASAAATSLLQVAQLALLARLLPPADFGLAAMMAVVLGLANAYGDMGLSNAVLTHSPLTRRALSSLYWIGIAAGVVLAAIVVAAAPLAAHVFSEPALTPLVQLAGLVFLVNPVGLQYQLLFQRELEFRPIAMVQVSAALVALVVSVACAWRGYGAFSFVIANLAAAVAAAAAYVLAGRRRWPVAWHCAPREVAGLLKFGAFQAGERTVGYFARNLDKAIIGFLLGTTALGFYNTAYQLMQKPLQVVQPLASRIATPLFGHLRGDAPRLANAYLLVVELAATALFPVFALLAVVAEPTVSIVLGPGWDAVVPVLRWLALLGCLFAIGFPIGNLLVACGRADLSFWLNVWRLLPFGAAVALGSRFGLAGVAIALVLADALFLFPTGFWIRSKLLGMPPGRFVRAIGGPAAIALASACVAFAVDATLPPRGDWPRLLAGTAAFATCYCGCFLLFRRQFILRVREHLGAAWGSGTSGDAARPAGQPHEPTP